MDEHLNEFDGIDPGWKLSFDQGFETDLADFLCVQMPYPYGFPGAHEGQSQVAPGSVHGTLRSTHMLEHQAEAYRRQHQYNGGGQKRTHARTDPNPHRLMGRADVAAQR